MVNELKNKVLQGKEISMEEALWLLDEAPFGDLCEAAHEITFRCASRSFDMCSIANVKSGLCSEDCKWCAQSACHAVRIDAYGIISREECLKQALQNERQGVRRFSLVASGRRPSDKEVDALCDRFRHIASGSAISLCASLGLATGEQLERLYEAGVTRYHCNLETAPSFFPDVCSTHTQAQKIETLKAARKIGMDICSGGIIGMGETPEQRVELAFALKELDVRSIPLNLLHPIKGTPLEHVLLPEPEEVIRAIAMFRFVHPAACLRFAGGRSQLDEAVVCRALYTGINSAIVGDLLTTLGSNVEEDVKRINQAGYEL